MIFVEYVVTYCYLDEVDNMQKQWTKLVNLPRMNGQYSRNYTYLKTAWDFLLWKWFEERKNRQKHLLFSGTYSFHWTDTEVMIRGKQEAFIDDCYANILEWYIATSQYNSIDRLFSLPISLSKLEGQYGFYFFSVSRASSAHFFNNMAISSTTFI